MAKNIPPHLGSLANEARTCMGSILYGVNGNSLTENAADIIFDPVLKYTAVILLLCSLLGQMFKSNLLIMQYVVNRKYIAENLCENRSRPELKCEGRCYLCKKLKKEEKKDQDNPSRRIDGSFELMAFDQAEDLPILTGMAVDHQFAPYTQHIYDVYQSTCFHPPACS